MPSQRPKESPPSPEQSHPGQKENTEPRSGPLSLIDWLATLRITVGERYYLKVQELNQQLEEATRIQNRFDHAYLVGQQLAQQNKQKRPQKSGDAKKRHAWHANQKKDASVRRRVAWKNRRGIIWNKMQLQCIATLYWFLLGVGSNSLVHPSLSLSRGLYNPSTISPHPSLGDPWINYEKKQSKTVTTAPIVAKNACCSTMRNYVILWFITVMSTVRHNTGLRAVVGLVTKERKRTGKKHRLTHNHDDKNINETRVTVEQKDQQQLKYPKVSDKRTKFKRKKSIEEKKANDRRPPSALHQERGINSHIQSSLMQTPPLSTEEKRLQAETVVTRRPKQKRIRVETGQGVSHRRHTNPIHIFYAYTVGLIALLPRCFIFATEIVVKSCYAGLVMCFYGLSQFIFSGLIRAPGNRLEQTRNVFLRLIELLMCRLPVLIIYGGRVICVALLYGGHLYCYALLVNLTGPMTVCIFFYNSCSRKDIHIIESSMSSFGRYSDALLFTLLAIINCGILLFAVNTYGPAAWQEWQMFILTTAEQIQNFNFMPANIQFPGTHTLRFVAFSLLSGPLQLISNTLVTTRNLRLSVAQIEKKMRNSQIAGDLIREDKTIGKPGHDRQARHHDNSFQIVTEDKKSGELHSNAVVKTLKAHGLVVSPFTSASEPEMSAARLSSGHNFHLQIIRSPHQSMATMPVDSAVFPTRSPRNNGTKQNPRVSILFAGGEQHHRRDKRTDSTDSVFGASELQQPSQSNSIVLSRRLHY